MGEEASSLVLRSWSWRLSGASSGGGADVSPPPVKGDRSWKLTWYRTRFRSVW